MVGIIQTRRTGLELAREVRLLFWPVSFVALAVFILFQLLTTPTVANLAAAIAGSLAYVYRYHHYTTKLYEVLLVVCISSILYFLILYLGVMILSGIALTNVAGFVLSWCLVGAAVCLHLMFISRE